jgi:arylsulfatase A-like enzyme
MEKTAIIFTTDHGYYFGEHGGLFGKVNRIRDTSGKPSNTSDTSADAWDHSFFYEEVTALPLLIYMPGTSPGTYDGLTSAVDLMPTVLDIMGHEIPSFVDGRSLLPMVRDTSIAGREYVLTTHMFVNPGEFVRSVDDVSRRVSKASTTTITTDEWTLLYSVEPSISELYHLPSDPKQEKNVIAGHPDIARKLHQYMGKLLQETGAPQRALEPRLELRL